MNFPQSLKLARKNLSEKVTTETLEAINNGNQLIHSEIIYNSLKVGDVVPNFALPNQNGHLIEIQGVLKKGTAVISFYRGTWCQFCSLELKALQQALPAIHMLGGTLLAISPQTFVDSSDNLAEFNFETLVDKRNKVARQFGIVFQIPEKSRIHYENMGISLPRYNGDKSFELPVPATFIVNQDGIIHHAFVDSDFTERLDPVEIVTILRRMAT
ncbi:MAG: peroxiredoxin-like family protein [Cyanobacteria bacterium J06573_2]